MGIGSEVGLFESVKYLYLRELSEPRDNSLRVVVDEAVGTSRGSTRANYPDLPELKEILTGARAIETTEACRAFELVWDSYVAYLVTEECVGSCGSYDDEVFSGKLFRVYAKSHFLEHLARDTGGHSEPMKHYKLTCLNHLIDVASYGAPQVRIVGPIASDPT